MRIAKGMYEIRVKDASGNGEKDTAIRFPIPQDEFKPLDLTYPRAAIITARAVAKECCELKNDSEIRMSALALNIGWHGIFIKTNTTKLEALVLEMRLPALTLESLYL